MYVCMYLLPAVRVEDVQSRGFTICTSTYMIFHAEDLVGIELHYAV